VILIPLLALSIGVAVGLLMGRTIPPNIAQYLGIACLAGLDTVFGGIKSHLEGKFRNDVFVSGFFANITIAFFLSWLGDVIAVNLFLVSALVFGQRIFNNLSVLRRFALSWFEENKRKSERASETVP